MQKVIIVTSTNINPEEEVSTRVAPLLKEEGLRIKSATTTMALHGNIERSEHHMNVPEHIFYVTTVVLEKPFSREELV